MSNSNNFSMRSALAMWGWLSYPLLWWVRVKNVSDDFEPNALIKPDCKTIFVMPRKSLSDYLVLRHFCRKLGLPKPTQTLKQIMRESFEGRAGYIFLEKLGWLGRIRSADLEQRPMDYIVEKLGVAEDINVQLVPVSILWGRNPRKDRKSSLLKLLFFDDEHAGILQKIFIVLVQGRDTVISFGRPIDVREQMEIAGQSKEVGRKIRRVLRVHFRTQRNAILGPKAYDRHDVVEYLTGLPRVQSAIDEACKGDSSQRGSIERRMRSYFSEIAAAQNYSFVRFAKVSLDYITKRVFRSFQVYHDDSIRKLANDFEIIYCAAHRSHVDYLLLPYWLFNLGLSAIHIAAGVNLSVWPLGVFLRRCGAFFLRRSFKGNQLYSLAFHEYLGFMISRGHSIGFFPEGGRSRTGRGLEPKAGMYSMIVQSYLRDPIKPIVFVPVYVGYDKVAEITSHVRELRGGKKEKESFLQLLKARHVLTRDHGNAYLSFGEPVFLNEFFSKHQPGWDSSDKLMDTKKNPDLVRLIKKLAYQVAWNTNEAAVMGDVALVSTVLLSLNQRALTQDSLETTVSGLRDLAGAVHEGSHVVIRAEDPKQMITLVEEISSLRRLSVEEGDSRSDVLFLDEMASMFSNYYKNNICHLFVVPGLIATVVENRGAVDKESLLSLFKVWWPLLSNELILDASESYYKVKVERSLEFMVARGLLHLDASKAFKSPPPHSEAYVQFNVLSNLHRPLLRRCGLSTLVLEMLSKKNALVTVEELKKRSEVFVKKMSLLLGAFDMELTRAGVFESILRFYKSCGLLIPRENDQYAVDSEILSRFLISCPSLLTQSEVEGIRRAKLESAKLEQGPAESAPKDSSGQKL